MAVDPATVDLETIETVTDIEPTPTLAVSNNDYHFGSFGPGAGALGQEAKLLLRELLDATPEDEPAAERVFARLGVGYSHAAWKGFDLYWADDEDRFVDALRTWNSAHSMSGA